MIYNNKYSPLEALIIISRKIIKLRKLFSIILFFYTCALFAQKEVSGLITNEKNTPLKDVVIQVKNYTLSTKSNSKGEYSIKIPENFQTIQFIKEGYITQEVDINSDVIDVTMKLINFSDFSNLSIEELMSIVVTTAGKKEEKIGDIPASVMVISREEIQRYGYATIDELLSHILGVYVHESYHPMGKTSIGVRGFATNGGGNDNIIILVNGVNQVEGVYNQYLLPKTGLAVELIDRIEVVRGPMSILYGSGAFYGAINIITNAPEKDNSCSFLGSYGSNNSNKQIIKIGKSGKNFKTVFNASHYTTDGINEPYSKMMSDASTLQNFGLSEDAKTKGMLKDERTYFNLSGNYSDFKLDLGISEYRKGGLLNMPSASYSEIKMNSASASINYDKKITDKIKINGKLSYLSAVSLASYSVIEPDSYISFGYNSGAYEFELNIFTTPFTNFNTTFGLFHRNMIYATNPFEGEAAWGPAASRLITKLSDDSRLKNNAFYLQADYAINKYIKILGGVRLEQMMSFDYESSSGPATLSAGRILKKDTYNNTKTRFIPRLAFIISPNKYHSIKLLYGEAFKHPPLGLLADNLYYISEYNIPDLRPAKISTYEINYLMTYSSKLSINFSVFRNELQYLISRKNFTLNDGGIGVYSANEGNLLTYGTELGFKVIPIKNTELDISGSYQETNNKQEGYTDIPVSQSPELLLYLKASYLFTKHVSLALTGNYVDEMVADYNSDKEPFGSTVPSYFSLNTNLRYNNLFTDGLFLAIYCSNILDKEIHYPVTSTSAFADKGILAPGRNYWITLGYNF